MSWADTLGTLTPEIVSRVAALWGTAPLQRVGLSANVVYRVESDDYLRLTHSSLRDEASLATGVDWARHLSSRGATVSVPLESTNGYFIERVGDWLATLWTGIRGKTLTDAMTDAQLEAWGEAAGRLHAASTAYQPGTVRTSSGAMVPVDAARQPLHRRGIDVIRAAGLEHAAACTGVAESLSAANFAPW
ncbi:MAG: phosphotransferase [Pleurocapsa sp. SU_196_0]|nr:phosphotransferase [Pleurocapsa sp. SU_196_0]